jgi:hypothetical protein
MKPHSVSVAAGVEVEVAEAAVALVVVAVVPAAAEALEEAVDEARAWVEAEARAWVAVPALQGVDRIPISEARPALDLIPVAAIGQTSAKAISVPGHRQARALEAALVSIPVRGPKLVRDPTSVAVLVQVIDQALARVLASVTDPVLVAALALETDRV